MPKLIFIIINQQLKAQVSLTILNNLFGMVIKYKLIHYYNERKSKHHQRKRC